jgi:hypothetical protein
MKEGAGEDPFAEDDPEPEPETQDPAGGREREDEARETAAVTEPTETVTDDTPDRGQSMQIPYKYRRDGVQDNRSRVPLFLQDDTKTAERDAIRQLEEEFGEDVSLTDLREAMVKTGLDNLDQVADHLETWGYGMTFED